MPWLQVIYDSLDIFSLLVCFFELSSLFPIACVLRGETFRGGFRRRPFVPGASCDPEVLVGRVDVVAEGPSSAGFQDDPGLLMVITIEFN